MIIQTKERDMTVFIFNSVIATFIYPFSFITVFFSFHVRWSVVKLGISCMPKLFLFSHSLRRGREKGYVQYEHARFSVLHSTIDSLLLPRGEHSVNERDRWIRGRTEARARARTPFQDHPQSEESATRVTFTVGYSTIVVQV